MTDDRIERFVFKAGKTGEVCPLLSIENATGHGLDILRDSTGRLTGIRQRLERRVLTIEYTTGQRIDALILVLPSERRVLLARYEYDDSGRLAAAHDSLGYIDRYEYDRAGRLTREVVKDGGAFSFSYDGQGRCLRTWGLDNYDLKSFRYLDALRWTEVTDSLGTVRRFQWLPSGQIVTEITPLGNTFRTEYDEVGRISARINPRAGTTRYEYDESGNCVREVNPLGHAHSLTWSPDHLPLTMTDAVGNLWKREYDRDRRLTALVDPRGQRWTFTHDDQGCLSRITDPLGGFATITRSATGAIQEFTDWGGATTRFQVDDFGKVVHITGPADEVTRLRYDLRDNLLEIIDPNGARTGLTYDAGRNVTVWADGVGHTTRYRYGPCGRRLERIDPLGNSTHFRWGSEPGRLEQVINENGEAHVNSYDPDGRVIKEVNFDGAVLTLEYDEMGECTAVTNGAGEKVVYELDAVGNVVKETLSDGTVARFAYDPFGRMIAAMNADCEAAFEYDPFDHVVKESQGPFSVERQFDAVGNLLLTRTSLGHEVINSYGSALWPDEMCINGQIRLAFDHDPRGLETSRRLPGGVEITQKFDSMGWLIEQQAGSLNGGAFIRRSYQYNPSGALLSIEDSQRGSTRYEYDRRKELLRAVRERGITEEFSYDRRGNVTRVKASGADLHAEYGPGDRLMAHGPTRFEYDGAGRLVKRIVKGLGDEVREWLFTWDANNRLRTVTTPDGVLWKYGYDAIGRRIHREGPAGRTLWVWDDTVVVHQLHGQAVDSTWIFDQRGFRPLCVIRNNQVNAIITDHLGTPQEVVDSRGSVLWAPDFHTWGSTNDPACGGECPIRFPGQWFDEASGLHYSMYRYYDPDAGRFISPDPLGLDGWPNLYAYPGNPINFIDPLGLGLKDWFRKTLYAAAIAVTLASGGKPEGVGKIIKDVAAADEKARRQREERERAQEKERAASNRRKRRGEGSSGDDDEEGGCKPG